MAVKQSTGIAVRVWSKNYVLRVLYVKRPAAERSKILVRLHHIGCFVAGSEFIETVETIWRIKLACESCNSFRQQGHSFCSVCGKSLQASASEEYEGEMATSVQDPVVDDDLRAWVEQGWTVQANRPCIKCGNPQTCSHVEIREEEKGYNPGTTIGCNPLVLLGVWLLDTLTKKFFPPRIVTTNIDRFVCPRCKSEYYENARIVSERPL